MDWYLLALRKYAQFNGRSRRREYWMYTLVSGMIWLVLYGGGLVEGRGIRAAMLLVLSVLYGLATFIPSLACGVRRLHDTGKSGWWMLLGFVPLVGLALLVVLALDSYPGYNQYGGNPKAAMPRVLAG